jgi:hypothetical protein
MQTYNDRTVDAADEVPEIPDMLEKVLLYAVNEGKNRILAGEELVPFTCLAVGDKLFMETHPGETAEDCYALARHTVEGARGAKCYAFCYDGYVDAEPDMLDCVIAEGGEPGSADGYAIGCVYKMNDGEDDGIKGTAETLDSENNSEADSDSATEDDVKSENPRSTGASVTFEEETIYIGEAPNFMERLKDADEYTNADIDPSYITGEGFEDGGNADVESDANDEKPADKEAQSKE